MFGNFKGFGQTVPPTCQDKQQAASQAMQNFQIAQAQFAANPGGDPTDMANAQAALAQAQSDLQACIANPPPTTAQQFQQGATTVGQILNLGTGIFKSLSPGAIPAGGNPLKPGTIMVAPAKSNTTIIIVGVVAIVIVLLVVLMKR